MLLKKLSPNLMVEDVNQSVEFYRDVLRFELVNSVPKAGVFDWAMMKSGQVEIMFQSRASLSEEIPALATKEIGGSLTFYIDVENLQELYAKFKDKATLVQNLHTTFFGKQEFSIRDCNSFILVFSEAV